MRNVPRLLTPLLALASLTLLTSSALADAPRYPWMPDLDPAPPVVPLVDHFSPPAGFTRVKVADDSFAGWLRTLPVRTDRQTVLAYDGRALIRPAAAIIALDVGARDRQQCADTAYRLHAEYLWWRGLARKARYHFTSGDVTAYQAWLGGERFKARGRGIQRLKGKRRPNTHATFRRWLDQVFVYAGTRSLPKDTRPIKGALEGGDVFVLPGGPGHAVVILDIAEDAQGRRAALIGQGFMPAEDLHVLASGGDRVLDKVWFLLPDARHDSLSIPSWWAPFPASTARRFPMPGG